MSPDISTGWHKQQMSFSCLSINWFGVLWVAMLQVFICRKIFKTSKVQNAVFHIFPESSSELDWSLSQAYSGPRALYLTLLTDMIVTFFTPKHEASTKSRPQIEIHCGPGHSDLPPSSPETWPARRNPSSGWQRWWSEARSRATKPPAASSCKGHIIQNI